MSNPYDPALWQKHYPALAADWSHSPTPLGKLLKDAATNFPEHVHLSVGDLELTFRETDALVDRLAAGLAQTGVVHGDRVAICLPNAPAYILLCFALWRIGAAGVGMNPLYAASTLKNMIDDCEPSLIVTLAEEELIEKIETAAADRPSDLKVLLCEADGSDIGIDGNCVNAADTRFLRLGSLMAAVGPIPDIVIDPTGTLAMIQYTGGTTGIPKGALLTHENLGVGASSVAAWLHRLEPGEEGWYAAAPLSHITGLICFIVIPAMKAHSVELVRRFDPASFIALAADRKVSVLIVIPTMLVAALSQPGSCEVDWTGVRHVIAGGAPVPSELKRRFRAATGLLVQDGYALTETACCGAIMPTDYGDDQLDATGVPLPGVILEVRSTENPDVCVPLGEAGEICFGGRNVSAGYWQHRQQDHLTGNGLFRTGDIGYLTDGGYLYIVDRLKDVIICSGYKVYPRAVEEAVAKHPAVADILAVGAPDPYRGETVAVAIVLKAGSDLSEAEIRQFLKDRLSPIEMPSLVRFVAELPKTANMKLSRLAVREWFK